MKISPKNLLLCLIVATTVFLLWRKQPWGNSTVNERVKLETNEGNHGSQVNVVCGEVRKEAEYNQPSTHRVHQEKINRSNQGSRKDFIQEFDPAVRRDNPERSERLILLWTDYFNNPNWIPDEVFGKCPVSKCRVTSDHRKVKDADVVVFHPRNMVSVPLPRQKWPHQRWLLFNLEPPYFNGIVPQRYNGLFNWTMTYRRDSDFVMSYSDFRPLKSDEKGTHIDLRSKTKVAAAVISNCFSINNRTGYVRELQKHMPVEFYGECGEKRCPVGKCGEILQTFKFYLSFENGHCLHYITEKFWNPMALWNSVPVVMGGASPRDYEAVAPPGSYINTADFSSPKDLANYLMKLDKDDKLYMEYHKWRETYRVNSKMPAVGDGWGAKMPENQAWCDLCAALHNDSMPAKVYTDLRQWYLQDTCPYEHPNLFCTTWDHCCRRSKATDMYTCF